MTTKTMHRLLLLGLLACQGCSSLTWAEYPLKDSGRVPNSATTIYWLDNRRVLFQGHFWNADGSINGPGGAPKNSETLYEWDVEAGTIKEHGDIGGGLCYANGYVRYWRRIDGEPQGSGEWVAGQLGAQANIDSQYVTLDRDTCKPRNDEALPDWARGKAVLRLRAEHGFLVLGAEKESRNTLVTYHPRGEAGGIVMPFKRREFFAPKYYSFKGAYLILPNYFVADPRDPLHGYNRGPWPKGFPLPVWWLYPDGHVEDVRLPTEARFGGGKIFGARAGVFYISPAYPGEDGLYKVSSDTKVTRILKGFIEGFAVSPEGCRVAIDHDAKHTGRQGRGTVKVIDLCVSRS